MVTGQAVGRLPSQGDRTPPDELEQRISARLVGTLFDRVQLNVSVPGAAGLATDGTVRLTIADVARIAARIAHRFFDGQTEAPPADDPPITEGQQRAARIAAGTGMDRASRVARQVSEQQWRVLIGALQSQVERGHFTDDAMQWHCPAARSGNLARCTCGVVQAIKALEAVDAAIPPLGTWST